MTVYRVVLDAYNSRVTSNRSTRVVTYTEGPDRSEAMRRLGAIKVAADGTVSDGFTPWPGTNNLPFTGPYRAATLPEWEVVSIRAVKRQGIARVIHQADS